MFSCVSVFQKETERDIAGLFNALQVKEKYKGPLQMHFIYQNISPKGTRLPEITPSVPIKLICSNSVAAAFCLLRQLCCMAGERGQCTPVKSVWRKKLNFYLDIVLCTSGTFPCQKKKNLILVYFACIFLHKIPVP